MHMKSFTLALMGCAAASFSYADSPITLAQGELTGSAALYSKYIYRGGVENDDLTLQFGLDYAHQSGVFLGYWGSTLDYNPSREDKNSGFEHDFYIGYGRDINEDWRYSSQLVAYVYQNSNKVRAENGESKSTTAYELINNVEYKDLSLGLAVMLADASFANAGDLYVSAAYSYPLPQDFSLNAAVGASLYNDRRDNAVVETSKDFVLSEAKLGVSKTLADTGLTAAFDYIWGGQSRLGENFDDHAVISLSYNF